MWTSVSPCSVVASACHGIAIFQSLHADDRTRLYQSMYQLEYQVRLTVCS
jgi:hypothetical protein